jgi:hypothetical protein
VFEPLKAIDALIQNDVDYVVVGGWGSLQYGATRLTQDLDICPELSAENLERLAQALTDLRAQLQIAPDQTVPVPIIDGRLLSQMQIGNWSTDAGGLDVLQHIPGLGSRQLSYQSCASAQPRSLTTGECSPSQVSPRSPRQSAQPVARRILRRYPSSSGSSLGIRRPAMMASTSDTSNGHRHSDHYSVGPPRFTEGSSRWRRPRSG